MQIMIYQYYSVVKVQIVSLKTGLNRGYRVQTLAKNQELRKMELKKGHKAQFKE